MENLIFLALHQITPAALVSVPYVGVRCWFAVNVRVDCHFVHSRKKISEFRIVVLKNCLELAHTASADCEFVVPLAVHDFECFLDHEHVISNVLFFAWFYLLVLVPFTFIFNVEFLVFSLEILADLSERKRQKFQ